MHNFLGQLKTAFLGFKKPVWIYLDYAATTPVKAEVFLMMKPYFSDHYGNPSAVHQAGLLAKVAVEDARTSVSRTLRVRHTDVLFTSGGTESNNLAVIGTLRYLNNQGVPFKEMEIISTQIEHPSISVALEYLKELGVVVHYVAVDADGLVDQQNLVELLSKRTVLVTLAYVNSEIGVVQDVKRISRTIKSYNQTHNKKIRFHLDACQAPLWLPIQLDSLGIDMISLDAGKCYGPKGVGVLAFTHQVKFLNITFGGSQEKGLRAGTENVPLIVGCAKALELAQTDYVKRSAATAALRDHLIHKLTTEIPDCLVNGSRSARVANNVNVSIIGIDTEYAVVYLDKQGIAASTKSACSGADGGGSSVVRVITGNEERALSTIRFSLGEETSQNDIEQVGKILREHINKMREFHTRISF